MEEITDVVILGHSFLKDELLSIVNLAEKSCLKIKLILFDLDEDTSLISKYDLPVEIVRISSSNNLGQVLNEINKEKLGIITSQLPYSSLWDVFPEHNSFLLSALNNPAKLYLANDISVLPSTVVSAIYYDSYVVFNSGGFLEKKAVNKLTNEEELKNLESIFSSYSDKIINNLDRISEEFLKKILSEKESFTKVLNEVYREIEKNNNEAANNKIQGLIKIQPENISVLLDLAILMFSKENYSESLNYLKTIFKKDHNNKKAAILLWEILEKELNQSVSHLYTENKIKKILLITNKYTKSLNTKLKNQCLSFYRNSSAEYYYLNFAVDSFIPEPLLYLKFDIIVLLPEFFESINEKNVNYYLTSPIFEPIYKNQFVVALLDNPSLKSASAKKILAKYEVKIIFEYSNTSNLENNEGNLIENETAAYIIPNLSLETLDERLRSETIEYILKKSFSCRNSLPRDLQVGDKNSKNEKNQLSFSYAVFTESFELLEEISLKNTGRQNIEIFNIIYVLAKNLLTDMNIGYAKEYYLLGDFLAALFYSKAALKYDQSNILSIIFHTASVIKLGESLEEQKKSLPVDDLLRIVLSKDNKDSFILMLIGDILFHFGKYNEAEHIYKEIIEIDIKNYGAYINLARIFYKSGRLIESISLFKEAAKLKPYNKEAYIELGRTAKAIGEMELLKTVYNILLEIDPDEPDLVSFKKALITA